MAPHHALGQGIGADEFVLILWHLDQANGRTRNNALPDNRRSPGPAGSAQPSDPADVNPDMAAGRIRLIVARLECALQKIWDWIGAVSLLSCLVAMKVALWLVILNTAVPCFRCLLRLRSGSGEVDKLTSMHWSLTSMIVHLRGLWQERSDRHRHIRKFLNQHRVSSVLSIRVRRHVARSEPQRVRADNYQDLGRDCAMLAVDLLEEMRMPALSAHPFFVSLRNRHPQLVQELCHEALSPLLKGDGEVVFMANEACSKMYIIINGQAQYSATSQQPSGGGPVQIQRRLCGGQWLSEAALWTGWVHRGELRSQVDCLFFALDASNFARVISSHKAAHAFAANYARKFVEGLNRGLQTDLVEAGPVEQ